MAQPGAPAMADADDAAPVIELQQICTRFGAHSVHDGLDLTVRRGEILGIAGGSGSGKSVLLREMILLQLDDRRSVVGIGHRGGAGLGHVTAPAG